MFEMKDTPTYYEAPACRILDLRMEAALLTGSTEELPIDPFDPEF
jgi:hypothetical protein